jgi:octaprenyl-diphosphate synthase
VNRGWGNTIAVLFGDYLYAKAMEMALRAESLRVMDRLAWITLRMTEGEMIQTRFAGRLDLTFDEYLDLIERKTAVLFGGCSELAGILAGVDGAAERSLREYGVHLGLAFQIVDDILDFTGDPAILGKPTASDLREGKATLPVLDLLKCGSARGRELVMSIVEGKSGDADARELVTVLRASGSLERAEALARRHAEIAVRKLDGFPLSPARRALVAVPDLLIARNR